MNHHKIIWEEEIKMEKCKNCHCNCHCKEPLHSHHYDKDLCTCDDCQCKKQKEFNEDQFLKADISVKGKDV